MRLELKYRNPARDSAEGWERESLPLGCGCMGANVFGIPERERIQITENSLVKRKDFGGLNNFAEIYLRFPHTEVADYERGLSLDDAVAYTRYTCGGVRFTREYFTSYPDRCLAVRLTAEGGTLDFTAAPEIPFVKPYDETEGDGGGKTGEIRVDGNTIFLSGSLECYPLNFEGQLSVETDGRISRTEREAVGSSKIMAWALVETAFKISITCI